MSLLNDKSISDYLAAAGFHQSLGLHLFGSIDSTNRYLKELPKYHPLEICCAEMQTQGRGRFQRQWFSPQADNLYCSMRWYLGKNAAALSALSLVISIAIMRTLEQAGVNKGIEIKWPNDLLWQHKKLCGILIESSQTAQGEIAVVVGMGLNVNINPADPLWHTAIDRPWCSLYEITGRSLDRNLLLAQLIVQLDNHIQHFIAEGFQPFMKEWQQWDYLKDKKITVTQGNAIIEGIAQGVTKAGQLIVLDDKQQTHHCASGEASIAQKT